MPVLVALLAIVLISCHRDIYYSGNVRIEDRKWSMYEPCIFGFTIDDTTRIFDINLSLRNSTDYPYRNIYFFVVTTFPSGNSVTDTLRVMLADEKGNWLGRGAGELRELSVPFRSEVYFPEKGDYHIKVIQGMRDTSLRGINDLGLTITKTAR